ncbi:MAG: ABC transporter ATP-binding protein [Methanospirillum sp.]|nr:ABC transporter ATP-binding protein [Methanospirillum sp.]
MISAANLTRVYRMGAVDVNALRGVSFEIEDGEFIGIMGPSGSGKSTLLHVLGLLDYPTSGSLTVEGVDVLGLSDRERTRFRLERLGYVFQDYALIGELTALENIYLTPMVRGSGRDEFEQAAFAILDEVGLADRADHLQHELSGGEQQRVAIARALVNRPAIVFADEPCANLDTATSRTILDLFARLNRELGQTIVMVSHEEWHQQYFDRVIRLEDGLVDQVEHQDVRGSPVRT